MSGHWGKLDDDPHWDVLIMVAAQQMEAWQAVLAGQRTG
jgi:hypothetical protein